MIIREDSYILERPRINALLDEALNNLVVCVTAGEGYGKTMAVKSFLRGRKESTVWINITERDNDPLHFWENVVQSVGLNEARTGKFLEQIGFPESQSQMTHYLSAVYGTASNREKNLIVVDDCHLIINERVLNFVNRLMAFPHRKETTILISRVEPKLNAMPLLSKGILSEINADYLRFNEAEVLSYFRLRNIELSRDEAKKILADTEGWILAISLIAEEMKKENKKYSPSYLKSGSFREMEERLFASAPLPIRRFLLILSLFEQWPLEALEEIALSMAGELSSDKLPPDKLPFMEEFTAYTGELSSLISYDSYLHGLKIHRAFLDFLKEKQQMLSREEVKTAYTVMAQWCMNKGLWIDGAINYGIAGDYEGLIGAIYSFPRLISRTAAASFLEIIDRVLNDQDRDEEDLSFLFLRHVTRAGMCFNLGLYDESRAALLESIGEFEARSESDLRSLILSSCYDSLGILSVAVCQIREALDYFKGGSSFRKNIPSPIPDYMAKASIGSYVSTVRYPSGRGDFEEYIDFFCQCLTYFSSSISGNLAGMDNLCRAEMAFFMGDLDGAEQEAREAVFKLRENMQYEAESKGLFYLLRIHLCKGDISAARESLEQMETQLDIADYINRYVIHEIMTGWFYAHIGETERMAPWLKNDYEESDLNLMFHNYETMVKAKYLFAEKKYKEALNFIEKKGVREGLVYFHLGMLEITVLKAAIQSRMGKEGAAIKTLKAAYEMASSNFEVPGVFNIPFIELGEDMREIARVALGRLSSTDKGGEITGIPEAWLESIQSKSSVYGKKLSTVIQKDRIKGTDDKIPFLRSQEMTVLNSLSQGFTREEIARGSSLSMNNVKGIIKTIYEKLGAFNRADAVRIAIKSGLIKN